MCLMDIDIIPTIKMMNFPRSFKGEISLLASIAKNKPRPIDMGAANANSTKTFKIE